MSRKSVKSKLSVSQGQSSPTRPDSGAVAGHFLLCGFVGAVILIALETVLGEFFSAPGFKREDVSFFSRFVLYACIGGFLGSTIGMLARLVLLPNSYYATERGRGILEFFQQSEPTAVRLVGLGLLVCLVMILAGGVYGIVVGF